MRSLAMRFVTLTFISLAVVPVSALELQQAQASHVNMPSPGAICFPFGRTLTRSDVRTLIEAGEYGQYTFGGNTITPGWDTGHVDRAQLVHFTAGQILDRDTGQFPISDMDQAFHAVDGGGSGPCQNGARIGFTSLWSSVDHLSSPAGENRLDRDSVLSFLIYKDGLGNIAFIWLNCGNFTQIQPTDLGSIRGIKFEDNNVNGIKDVDEPVLPGWRINMSGPVNDSTVTDENGAYRFDDLPAGDYTLSEEIPTAAPPWRQTAPNPPPDGDGRHHESLAVGEHESGLDFGNVRSAEKHGQKFYDLNRDGIKNDDQVVAGYPIRLTGTVVNGTPVGPIDTVTDSSGNYSFTFLLPGSYTVCEVPDPSWVPTTPNCIDFELTPGEIETGNDFGNVCIGPGGGHTPGYWSNKNGEETMKDGGSAAPELELLRGLNLRDAVGDHFDPKNVKEFQGWLLDANAVNMAYMLSVHTAAMNLNLEVEFVDGTALIYAPALLPFTPFPGLDPIGFISVNGVVAPANTELGVNGLTLAGSEFRSYQEALKDSLDAANSDESFLQPEPCEIGARTIKTKGPRML